MNKYLSGGRIEIGGVAIIAVVQVQAGAAGE
jgi:hypothetical protein